MGQAMAFSVVQPKMASNLLESVREEVFSRVDWRPCAKTATSCLLPNLALANHHTGSIHSRAYTIVSHFRPVDVGYVRSDQARNRDDPLLSYLLGALVNGDTFEVLVTGDSPAEAVFYWNGQFLGVCMCRPKRAILGSQGMRGCWVLDSCEERFGHVKGRTSAGFTSLAIVHPRRQALPITLASPDSSSFMTFVKAILKLITLYPLWWPGWTRTNDNLVMAYEFQPLDSLMQTQFYFLINLFFRMMLFSTDASDVGGG